MLCRWFASALITMYAGTTYAGAWTQSEGHGLFITQVTRYSTDSFFDTEARKQSQPEFTKYEIQPYIEYGLKDWLTVGGSAYLQSVAQSGRNNYGIADPEAFARLRLYQTDARVLSIQPLVKFGSRFNREGTPRGGSKSHDAELSALYGGNLHVISDKDYFDTRIGYRWRDNDLSDQWRADAAIGLSVTNSIQLVPAVRAIYSPGMTDAAVFSENGDLDYSVLKAEVAGIYHVDENQWLQATLAKHVYGVQTGAGYSLSLGYAKRF